MDKKWMWGFLYLVSIMLGNLFVIWFGIVKLMAVDLHDPTKVWAAITFPAGVVFIGLTFSFRDFAQRHWGKKAVWYWMIAATIITLFLNIKIALASVSAFLIAETIDWLIFSFSTLSFKRRIVVSNLVSTPIDSAVFVTLAFGWYFPAIWGQAVVKLLSSFLVLPFIKDQTQFEHIK
jgi:uncharacterized PurR-regulated membrane protein YhhQ (DUF165 family)